MLNKRIKEAIKIVSSSNASQKLLVSEVLELVKLISLVPTTNAVWKIALNVVQSQNVPAIIYYSRTSKFPLNCYYL